MLTLRPVRFVPLLICAALAFHAVCAAAGAIEAEAEAEAEMADQPVGSSTGDPLVRLPELINAEVGLILSNGDELSGVLTEVKPGHVVLSHSALGEIRIERVALTRVRTTTQPQEAPATINPGAEAEIESGVTPPDVPPTTEPDRLPDPPKATWSGRLQLGLSGSRGANDRDSARVVATAKRDAKDSILTLRSTYQQTRSNGERTENRFTARGRNEWLRGESNWSGFLESEIELAEFLDYDARLRGGAGLVYRFIDNDETLFSTRLGLGAARQFNGPREDIDPEAIVALAFSHRLSPRQRFEVAADYYPDLRDTEQFRAEFRAGYEIGLNEKNNVKLRLSLEDRYNSSANIDRNNLDYFAELVYEF
ncbi:MAG: YdiY family protein [Phycisphaerales bacterium JB065]